MKETFYLCGYALVYPFLKKELRNKNIRIYYYNKYLLGLDKEGNLHKIFISRVSIKTNYEVFSYHKRSNFFKLCKAVYGVRNPRNMEFARITPNDLLGHYVTRIDKKHFVKSPKSASFCAEIVSRCISLFTLVPNSMVFIEDSMIKKFIKSRSIYLD
jgi:hypothetical protein